MRLIERAIYYYGQKKEVNIIFAMCFAAQEAGFFGGGNVTLQADTGSTGYVSTEVAQLTLLNPFHPLFARVK